MNAQIERAGFRGRVRVRIQDVQDDVIAERCELAAKRRNGIGGAPPLYDTKDDMVDVQVGRPPQPLGSTKLIVHRKGLHS